MHANGASVSTTGIFNSRLRTVPHNGAARYTRAWLDSPLAKSAGVGTMEDRSNKLRAFFASYVCVDLDPRLMQAFGDVRRERFVGPGPWWVHSGSGYIKTPDDDPAFI